MFLKNGINEFIPKPIDVRKLNVILTTWIPLEKQQKNSIVVAGGNEGSLEVPVIPGVDTKVGLMNTGGSVKSYTSILSFFCKDLDERLPQIRKAAAEEDFPSYTTMVHAIKGAARSLGAMEVGDLAAELESAGRNRNSHVVAERTDLLLRKLRELAGYIRDAIEEPPDNDTSAPAIGSREGNDEAVQKKTEGFDVADLGLDALKDALNSMDTRKINTKIAEINARELNRITRKCIGDLELQIVLFEYDEAIGMIDEALLKVPGENND
jgi:HPt (histidine-containing phosphotransfer) domain-containing protein